MPHISLYFPETFEVVGQYVSIIIAVYLPLRSPFLKRSFLHLQLYYLGSVLGFYFPYDFCLFERLNPLVSYFIRFIPLLLAVVIMPATILLRWGGKDKMCVLDVIAIPVCVFLLTQAVKVEKEVEISRFVVGGSPSL